MRLSVVYHSESGNTRQVAALIAQGAGEIQGVEAKIMGLEELDREFIKDSAAVVFGCPTYCGTFSWQMKRWFDTTDLDLEGKLGGVFATENYLGGGADVAELGLIGQMLVRGMLVYSAGVARGGPSTHYGAVVIKEGEVPQRDRARILGRRIAEKARVLFGERAPIGA